MSIYDRFEQHADKTFAIAAARYLAEFQKRSYKRAKTSIDALLPYIGHLRLIDVDDEALAQFKHDRMNGCGHFKKKAMIGTANKDIQQGMAVLNKASRVYRWLPSVPKFIRLEGDVKKAYPLSYADQDKWFRMLPTGWDVAVGVFAMNTGCRKEEIFGLKWTDKVDLPQLGKDVFVFVLNRTKNKHTRAVICNSIARRCVEHMKRRNETSEEKSHYVFPPGICRSSGKVWQQSWERAGLPTDKLTKKGLHNCRHTFGHRLRAAGVPEEDRNALLGHNNYNLAQHYAMPDIARLLEAAEKITERREMIVIRSAHDGDMQHH